MKLLNKLYHILSKEVDTAVSYDIELHADSLIYQAHFPGEPITPGACIIQIAQELLEDYTGKSLTIQSIKSVKFLNVISPTETTRITYLFEQLRTDDAGQHIKAVCLVKTDDKPLSKLSFTCTP